jgi:hypothetical protein
LVVGVDERITAGQGRDEAASQRQIVSGCCVAAEDKAGLLGGAKPNFADPAQSPGEGWEWRGNGPPGSSQGSWYNPSTGASLHPYLGHPDPIGPHYDYKAPDGKTYRIGPDGTATPK